MPILSSLSLLGTHFSSPEPTPPSGNWYDDSSSAHQTVALNGSITQSIDGGGVKSAFFDGNTQYFSVDPTVDFGFSTGDFTIEAFVNLADSYPRVLFSVGGVQDGVYLRFNTPAAHDDLWVVGSYATLGTQPIPNAWTHVAVVRFGNSAYGFINGSLVTAMGIDNLDLGTSRGLTIGVGNYNFMDQMAGKIAALRIVKGVALYTSAFTVPTNLPTAVAGTVLLMNFRATAVPSV